jgi:hypothetical protein
VAVFTRLRGADIHTVREVALDGLIAAESAAAPHRLDAMAAAAQLVDGGGRETGFEVHRATVRER